MLLQQINKYRMLLLANGDSFTYGHGLSPLGTGSRQWPGTSPEDIELNGKHALENSWPAQLAAKLDCRMANISKLGGSNDRVIRTTLQYLAQHGNHDTLVIIGWSDPSRREVHIDSDIVVNALYTGELATGYKSFMVRGNDIENTGSNDPSLIKWARNYTRYGWDEAESYVRYYSQILLMSAYLEKHSVPYLYFNSIHNPHAWQKLQQGYSQSMTQPLYDQINWRSFAADTDKLCMMDRFPQHLDETLHLTLQGHQAVSDLLYKELKKMKIIAA